MKQNTISRADAKAAAGAARYGLLRTAQGVLWDSSLEGWKDQHRTCWCSRSLKRASETVDVWRNEARDGATFAGLNRCGNLHTCPVCAAKVGELRRKQLSAAMVTHTGQGGYAYLVTFTFPHEADQPLAELLAKFDKARQKFQNAKAWKAWKKARGVVGVVNSLEFTISQDNGWHPHVHMLVFCQPQAFDEGDPVNAAGDLDSELIQQFRKAWVNTLFKVGLGEQSKITDMMAHALNVRGGAKAAEYIAKFGRDERWGASSELARSHGKVGAAGERWGMQHFTPFQLLVWAEKGDGWAIACFREFAEVVEGKRALVWSPKLKAALGVEDCDEEDWVQQDQPAPDQIKVGTITAEQFSMLQRTKTVPRFLEYAATCCDTQEHLEEFFETLADAPRVARGDILVKKFIGGGYTPIYNFA